MPANAQVSTLLDSPGSPASMCSLPRAIRFGHNQCIGFSSMVATLRTASTAAPSSGVHDAVLACVHSGTADWRGRASA